MSDERPPPPPPRPAISVSRPSATGDTVTVACKVPQGMILRCFAFEDFDEPQRDGSIRKGRIARPIPDMVFTVRGTWVASAGQAYHRANPSVAELLPGGYALTIGVPKHIWDTWLMQNQGSWAVENRIIFAHASHSSVHKEAIENRAVVSGLEPLDPTKPAERMGGIDRRLRIGVLEQGEGSASR